MQLDKRLTSNRCPRSPRLGAHRKVGGLPVYLGRDKGVYSLAARAGVVTTDG